MNYSSLPNDKIIKIALNLSINDINYYCQINMRFNELICGTNSNWFWNQKFMIDFGKIDINEIPEYYKVNNIINWKLLYQNYRTIYVFGSNYAGKLGLGDKEDRLVPTLLPPKKFGLPNVRGKLVSCGYDHTMIIDTNDNIWGMGYNGYGQLGLNDKNIRVLPTLLPDIKAKIISCGANHTMIIDLDNNIWGMGYGYYEQLGLGGTRKIRQPTILPNIKAKSVSCGDEHTIVIDLEDNIYVMGRNWRDQLGLGDHGSVYHPMLLPNIKGELVACGYNHSMIIDTDGNIYVMGYNKFGQLGLGDNNNRSLPELLPGLTAKSISCGGDHTMIIDLNNDIWVMGRNNFGQLGLDDKDDRNTPIKLVNIKQLNGKAHSITCGQNHTLIIDLDNNSWVMGKNDGGQLGLGGGENRYQPTLLPNMKALSGACGSDHTILLI